MFEVKPFRENIYVHYDWYNGTVCPLCDNYKSLNKKYEMDNGYIVKKNVVGLDIKYGDKEVKSIYYCLNCETLFTRSHAFALNGLHNRIDHAYIISKFEYKNKVLIGTPSFDSILSFCKAIQDQKLANLTFSCTCANGPSDPKAFYPETEYPNNYKCQGDFVINGVIGLHQIPELYLIPKNTKQALKK